MRPSRSLPNSVAQIGPLVQDASERHVLAGGSSHLISSWGLGTGAHSQRHYRLDPGHSAVWAELRVSSVRRSRLTMDADLSLAPIHPALTFGNVVACSPYAR